MKGRGRIVSATVAVLVALTVPGLGAGSAAGQAHDDDLVQARDATAAYWDVSDALGDGFVEADRCQTARDGSGSLGFQYANPERMADRQLAIAEPESLIYLPEDLGGGRRLAAVEYSVPYEGQQPPVLFGYEFDGPATRSPALGERYFLRVWLYSPNPKGLFAEANPREACDRDDVVAPQIVNEGCHEVHALFDIGGDHVRDVGKIPEHFTLQVDARGNATVGVRTLTCERSIAGENVESAKITLFDTQILPPDWPGPSITTFFGFETVSDNEPFVKWARHRLGMSPQAARLSDDLASDLDALVRRTGEYEFRSSDFVQTATVGEPGPEVATLSARFWTEGARGTGLAQLWNKNARLGQAVDVQVAPRRGTLVADMLGCEPTGDPHLCAPVQAREGLVLDIKRDVLLGKVRRGWWNPRFDRDEGGLLN